MDGWFNVCEVDKFRPGEARIVDIDNTGVAVFNIGGEYYAIRNLCTHDNSPLLMETLDPGLQLNGTEISCPRHGAVFCLRTGNALSPPAYEAVNTFETRIDRGVLQVRACSR